LEFDPFDFDRSKYGTHSLSMHSLFTAPLHRAEAVTIENAAAAPIEDEHRKLFQHLQELKQSLEWDA
jgi:hypothetical protein